MGNTKIGLVTKKRILKAARDEFLEKGYDGAKMDQIAGRAGLNKVMLYYHFDSKENILRELIQEMLTDAKIKIQKAFQNVKRIRSLDPEILIKRLKSSIGGNREIIRLISVEVLKGNLKLETVLDTLKELYETVLSLAQKTGKISLTTEEFYIRAFFFQTVPLILFPLFSEDMSRAYGINLRKIEQVFTEKFRDTFYQTLYNSPKQNRHRPKTAGGNPR